MANDPAFLFYDGDAAKDVSHMNRLERGCYFDLIQAQRKFGAYTLEQVQKILGKDFDKCWPAIEMVLTKNAEGKYFIQWVDDSIEKRKVHANKNRERIQNYWDKKKNGNTTEIPRKYHGNTNVYTKEIPLVNANENEDMEGKGVQGERERNSYPDQSRVPEISLAEIQVGAVIQLFKITKQQDLNANQVRDLFEVFKIQNFTGKKFYSDVGDIYSHFINWCKTQNVENGKRDQKNGGRALTGAEQLAAKLQSQAESYARGTTDYQSS